MKRVLPLAVLILGSLLAAGQSISSSSIVGVQGAASSTNNDIPSFSGTSGNALQDSGGCTLTSSSLNCLTGLSISLNSDVFWTRGAAATWQMGAANSATPVAQTLQGQGSRGGTDTNVAGGNVTLEPGDGTGTGAGTQLSISRNLVGTTGSTAQPQAPAWTACESKTLSNTTGTVQTLATIGLASNSAGGASGTITVTCTDGTNFDSETQSFNVSYVNKAGVGTVGTPAITTSTAANNSGSCTIAMSATFSGSTLSIKVTPVIGTIVPTLVTAYLELNTHGAGAVSCQ